MSQTDFFTYYRSVGKTPVGETLPVGRDYDFVIKKCDDNESIAIPPGALITAYVIFYWISHSHLFNKLEIHITFMYTYIYPLSLFTHSLIHKLI